MDSLGNEKTMMPGEGGRKAALSPGDVLGQYKVIRLLGRGGMGEVYEVEHTTLGRSYALKLLPADFSQRSGALERFRREARVMANLEHENIVRVDDFGETDGRYWLRMDLVEGVDCDGRTVRSLREYAECRGGRLPQDEVLSILRDVGEGLRYAHDKGAVHRDLKPGNILLTGDGRARIADFGLVRLVGEEWVRSQAELTVKRSMASLGSEDTPDPDAGTSTNALLGTFEYMSPEQKRGEEADERSDLYSLGLIAYRLLTGRGNVLKLPSRVDPDLSGAWDELIESSLEETPSERMADCGQWIAGLQRVADDRRKRAARERAESERKTREAEREKAKEESQRKQREMEEERRREIEEQRRCNEERARENRAATSQKPAKAKNNRSAGKSAKPFSGRGALKFFIWLIVLGGLGVATYFSIDAMRKPWSPPGKTRTVDLGGGVKMDLVWVPAGTFWMGSNLFGDDDEKPAHSVRISQGFWMGRTEVMQRQWERIMGNNPSYFKGFFKGSHPVESVSWNDCQEFIRKLNRQVSGGGFRLPTEAEWEYACQAGTTGDYAGDLDAMGWYSSNSRKKTHPVGRKQPNAWWLYDMHGNVWEWCDDAKRSYTSTSQTDPRGSFGSSRVLRGGSWNYESGYCRSTYRTDCDPTYAGSHIGFRVVFSSPRDAVNEPETTSDRRGETRIQTKFTAVSGERPTAGTDWTSPSTGMEFVWVEEMGLWVGKYEVTNGEYRKKEPRHDSKEYEGHSLDGPRQPVVYVNFDDAKAYADWLTQRDREELNGMRYRVPSEDEWMKFAQCDRDWEYPWGNNWPPRSRQAGNYHGQEGAGFWSKISGYNDGHPVTCNVEEIWANPWGLYGVGGNVWECCAVDKSGRSFGAWRGASWGNNLQDYMRCSYRFSYGGSFRGDYYGFRLVLSPQ